MVVDKPVKRVSYAHIEIVFLSAGPVGQPLPDNNTAVRLALRFPHDLGGWARWFMTDAPSDRRSLTAWSELQDDWLPIVLAVFRFAIASSGGPQSTEASRDDSNPFSIEAFENFNSRQVKADAEIADNETDPLSLRNLRTILRDKARAGRAEIDLDEGYFRFFFDLPTGAAAVMSYAPCDLAPPRDPAGIDPRLLARFERDAIFNKEDGPFKVDEMATLTAQQVEDSRAATSFVWNQLMLPAFGHLVSMGRVNVYARMQLLRPDFEQLPADLWSRLTVEDWGDGIACDSKGNDYYSLRAEDGLPMVSPPQAEAPANHGLVLPKSRRPGRKKGQGSFEQADQPLLCEMRDLIAERKATSPEEAAGMVAEKAHGPGTWESKKERLGRRYRKNWPDLN